MCADEQQQTTTTTPHRQRPPNHSDVVRPGGAGLHGHAWHHVHDDRLAVRERVGVPTRAVLGHRLRRAAPGDRVFSVEMCSHGDDCQNISRVLSSSFS